MIRNWLICAGAACVLTALMAPAVKADEIDPLLLKDAKELIKVFQSRGYKNVAVLKFEVQRGGAQGPVSMSNGTLNSMMATRLENALILSNDDKAPIGVTRNASEAAAKADKAAGYHTKAGREKLFAGSYPLAWGNKSVAVDAILTGRVTVSPDYKKSTVTLRMFDKKDTKIVDVARFDAPIDRSLIVDLGMPFAVSKAVIAKRALLINPNPGADNTSPVSTTEDMVLEDIVKGPAEEDRNRPARPAVGPGPGPRPIPAPMPLPQNPIQPVNNNAGPKVLMQAPRPNLSAAKAELDSVLKFDVYYNEQLVAWTADNQLPPPNPGDRIEFRVRANEKIGMILRVNGVNTADYDRTPKMINDYTKWVLSPGQDYTIRGFYTNDNKVVLFTGRAQTEVDAAQELGDERRVGKIDLDILREMPNVAGRNPGNNNNEPMIAQRKLDLRAPAAGGSISEVKGQLRQLASRKLNVVRIRNLIVGDNAEDANVDTTTFQGVHAIHFPITYYDPRAEAQAQNFLLPENE